ncbi:heparan-alpha-glucosaminide N-acetyltransferase domain-containing protein [Salinicola peritrichatus]|uniref:heparan-alpha-glucosaminide N-acetyltransferase domain-containing protein n=1 Tax=Salinicola peritrichatus TaxID=1267424 RepID=UPI000DA18381|nr:OpgC domain-containing protein [Salinicola peritrichatus]
MCPTTADTANPTVSTPPTAGRWWRRPFVAPRADSRIEAIDLARGFAVVQMILSHGVKGLLSFEQFPDWGIVPIHLLTKFSSSLFVMVFGIALAVAFLPRVDDEDWPRRRWRLIKRGLIVLFWYKVLTVIEMSHRFPPRDIIDALLYQRFPSFVEILGFYAIALLWMPWFLSVWKRFPGWLRLISPALMAGFGIWLARVFDFWGVPQLQALIVEHPDYYVWGQLTRGPLVLAGLLIGEWMLHGLACPALQRALIATLAALSVALFAIFFWLALPTLDDTLDALARNVGKHPPALDFMLFSLGGALALLAIALLGGRRLATWLRPVTIIGSDALQAFIFHISVIFLLFRITLGYWHNISYTLALSLTIGLIFATTVWIRLVHRLKARWNAS